MQSYGTRPERAALGGGSLSPSFPTGGWIKPKPYPMGNLHQTPVANRIRGIYYALGKQAGC